MFQNEVKEDIATGTEHYEIRLKCLSIAAETYESGDDVLGIAQDMYDFVMGVKPLEGPHLVKG